MNEQNGDGLSKNKIIAENIMKLCDEKTYVKTVTDDGYSKLYKLESNDIKLYPTIYDDQNRKALHIWRDIKKGNIEICLYFRAFKSNIIEFSDDVHFEIGYKRLNRFGNYEKVCDFASITYDEIPSFNKYFLPTSFKSDYKKWYDKSYWHVNDVPSDMGLLLKKAYLKSSDCLTRKIYKEAIKFYKQIEYVSKLVEKEEVIKEDFIYALIEMYKDGTLIKQGLTEEEALYFTSKLTNIPENELNETFGIQKSLGHLKSHK